MPDMTYIVTGGNRGLGLGCVRSIISREPNALVVVPCREKDGSGTRELQQLIEHGAAVRIMSMDLKSLQSVRDFVAEYQAAKVPPLKGLVCNAGLKEIRVSVTPDGYETTFQVNHLGHHLLVNLLLPLLAPDANVVFVSSGTHDPAAKTGHPEPVYTSADQIAHFVEPGFAAGQRRYATSKLLNVYCTYELARRLAASTDARLRSVRVNAIDPGMVPGTGLIRQLSPFLRVVARIVIPLLTLLGVIKNVQTVPKSGKPVSGEYFSEGRVAESSTLSYNEGNAAELWTASSKMIGLAS